MGCSIIRPPFHSGTAAPSSRSPAARRDCGRASFRPAGAGHRQPVSAGRSYCSDWWADCHMQTGTESTSRVQRRPPQTPLLIQRPPPCLSIGECSVAAGRQRIEAERLSPMKDIAPLDAGPSSVLFESRAYNIEGEPKRSPKETRPEKTNTPNEHFFIAARYPFTQRPRHLRATGPQSKLAQ